MRAQSFRSFVWFSTAWLTLLGASPGAAQAPSAPFNLQLARPAMDAQGLYSLEASQVLPAWEPSFGLVLGYLYEPLVLAGSSGRLRVKQLVAGRLQAAVGLPYGIELGAGLPVMAVQLMRASAQAAPTHNDAQGLADLDVAAKARILDTSRYPLGLTLLLSATFPVGDGNQFLGRSQVTLAPVLVLDAHLARRRLHLLTNLGARFALGASRQLADDPRCSATACSPGAPLRSDHQLLWGIGAAWSLLPARLSTFVEVRGQLGLSAPFAAEQLQTAQEAALGLKLYLAGRSHLLLGVGRGLHLAQDNHPAGSPALRLFAGFIFEPTTGDRDGDGIADDVDRCPDDPEDKDGFEDDDGCPDLDNDKDGIPDTDDLCPNEAVTRDNDKDRDGCPDRPLVRRAKGVLLVLEKIHFETNRATIRPISHPLLDAVVSALKVHQDIALLEIQGHADERGTAAHNLRLTSARAKAVYRHLVQHGADSRRLRHRGYGETRPIDRGHGPAAWSKNRRVEFVIVKRR